MATSTEELKKILGTSTLFSEGGGDAALDLEKLTPRQSMALARQGRSAGAQKGGTSSQRITGSATGIEKQILSQAGSELSSSDNIIVPNVQRSRTFREDERSRGGLRGETKSTRSVESPQAAGISSGDGPPLSPNIQKASGIGAALSALLHMGKVGKAATNKYSGKGIDLDTSSLGNVTGGIENIIAGSKTPFKTGFEGAEQLYGNQGPAAKVDVGYKLPDVAGGISANYTPLSAGAQGIDVGALGIGNPASYGGTAFSGAGAIGSGIGNVGVGMGSDAAAATAAGAGTSAGAGAGTGIGAATGAVSAALPYIGLAYFAYSMFDANRKSKIAPHSYGDEELLSIQEGSMTKDPWGNKIDVIEHEDGRYVKDPYAERNYGISSYHNLNDEERMNKLRTQILRSGRSKLFAPNVMDRSKRESYNTSDWQNYDVSGKSLAEIRKLSKEAPIENQEQDPAAAGGLGR